MHDVLTRLLAPDEPQPVTVTNEAGRSAFVIVADHAGNYLPRRLQSLGLGQAELERHIAFDIGVGAVCGLMGDKLGAMVIRQNYSRLAIDCNRMPGSETSIVEVSERTAVPGNIGLGETQIRPSLGVEQAKPFREIISRTTAASPRTRANTPSASRHHGDVAASTLLISHGAFE
jgi:predicted N-formylglutamate amidohydrolase